MGVGKSYLLYAKNSKIDNIPQNILYICLFLIIIMDKPLISLYACHIYISNNLFFLF